MQRPWGEGMVGVVAGEASSRHLLIKVEDGGGLFF